MSYRTIEVSEIVDYVYCRRAWWLKRMAGHIPDFEPYVYGETYHRQQRRLVQNASRSRQLALFLIFLAVSIIVYWLVTNS